MERAMRASICSTMTSSRVLPSRQLVLLDPGLDALGAVDHIHFDVDAVPPCSAAERATGRALNTTAWRAVMGTSPGPDHRCGSAEHGKTGIMARWQPIETSKPPLCSDVAFTPIRSPRRFQGNAALAAGANRLVELASGKVIARLDLDADRVR